MEEWCWMVAEMVQGKIHGAVNGGRYLPLKLYLRIFIVEKPPDFLVQNDAIVQGIIT